MVLLFSSLPLWYVCTHVRVGHDLMEGSLGYTAKQLSRNDLFLLALCYCAHPLICYKCQSSSWTLRTVYSALQYSKVQCSKQ